MSSCLHRRSQVPRAGARGGDAYAFAFTQGGLRDDLLLEDDSDLAHAPNTTRTSRPQGAQANGAFYALGASLAIVLAACVLAS